MFNQKEYHKRWRLTHPQQYKIYRKNWRIKHPNYDKKYKLKHREQIRGNQKRWREKHPEEAKLASKNWQLAHPEQKKARTRKWAKEHPESLRKYRQTPKGREVFMKNVYQRRNLGFVPLNKYFEGSVGHHINTEQIIYMPEELHKSIKHSVLQNKSMDKINKIAFDYL